MITKRVYVYHPDRPKRQPSDRRAKVLEFVKSEIAAGRGFPDPEVIAGYMGWSHPGSATNALTNLVYDGHLRRITTGNRKYRFVVA